MTSPKHFTLGRTFLHPALDYLLVGGGLSLIVVGLAYLGSDGGSADSLLAAMPLIFLLSNSTHFGASTVRLYTKEDSLRTMPFLTMAFPLVVIGVATLAIAFPAELGRHVTALFLTWSPYHYAAQAYGLAVMYCYRSGSELTDGEKRLLWLCCMVTFARALIAVPEHGLGIWWILPWSTLGTAAGAQLAIDGIVMALAAAAFALPLIFYVRVSRRQKRPVPAISLLIVLTNAIWFFAFRYVSGMVWATVFHGIQYLTIVTIFHVKERMRAPGNRRGWAHHTLTFYAASLLLAYLTFQCWPSAYVLLGFGYVESSMLVVAVINIHHFIVDRYIWRLRKDRNYKTVAEAAPHREASPGQVVPA
ncbi:MAG TPA: hypothetical protein VMT52_05600 [Planctomycetota bacterium]|nr:hypothetical protein [Planctomycetota bacterium]